MVQMDEQLRKPIVGRNVSLVKPKKIILFGSRSRGAARLDSDIDLLVIARSEEPRHRRAAPIYGALSDILAPMDILVYSPQEGGKMERCVASFCHHGGPPRNRAV